MPMFLNERMQVLVSMAKPIEMLTETDKNKVQVAVI